MAARKKTIKGSAMADSKSIIPRDYADWLASLKSRISGELRVQDAEHFIEVTE